MYFGFNLQFKTVNVWANSWNHPNVDIACNLVSLQWNPICIIYIRFFFLHFIVRNKKEKIVMALIFCALKAQIHAHTRILNPWKWKKTEIMAKEHNSETINYGDFFFRCCFFFGIQRVTWMAFCCVHLFKTFRYTYTEFIYQFDQKPNRCEDHFQFQCKLSECIYNAI